MTTQGTFMLNGGIDLTHAEASSPKISDYWQALGGTLQRGACQGLLRERLGAMVEVVATNKRGEITVRLRAPMAAAMRGQVLLEAEAMLKEMDMAITIVLEAAEDKNALRKLRGVIIHDSRE